MSAFGDISNLSNLLNESREAQESHETVKYSQPPVAITPSNIVFGNNKGSNAKSVVSEPVRDPKEIWAPDEILTEDALIDWKDERPVPRYEFSYKQSVGTEDTFLGMSDKTPLTSDCTHLVVKIHFPKATMKELDLDVTKNRVKAASKTHHLYTYFPVNVDPDNGKAKFDTAKEVLTLTLPIVPDY
jgi:dynein assembly factor 6, axonemal